MRLRSLLFVPGDRPDQMQKALLAGADALILDLEDSVAEQRKQRARIEVAEFLNRPRTVPLFVRVNPLRSGFTDQDLDAVAPARPNGVVLPKADGAASVNDLTRRMVARGMPPGGILPLVTGNARGDFPDGRVRGGGRTTGGRDVGRGGFVGCGGGSHGPRAGWRLCRAVRDGARVALFAAHAAAVPAIDTVYPAFRDADGLSRYARRAPATALPE